MASGQWSADRPKLSGDWCREKDTEDDDKSQKIKVVVKSQWFNHEYLLIVLNNCKNNHYYQIYLKFQQTKSTKEELQKSL